MVGIVRKVTNGSINCFVKVKLEIEKARVASDVSSGMMLEEIRTPRSFQEVEQFYDDEQFLLIH